MHFTEREEYTKYLEDLFLQTPRPIVSSYKKIDNSSITKETIGR